MARPHTPSARKEYAQTHPQLDAPHHRVVVPSFVALLLSAVVFGILYVGVMPRMIEAFALHNLRPAEMHIMNFNGVFAAPSAEGARLLGSAPDVSRAYITGELIIDLTPNARRSEMHGYTKTEREWYVKAPALGEEAVVLTPMLAFGIGIGAISLVIVLLISIVLPPSVGLMSAWVEQSVARTRSRIQFQTGLTDDELDVLTLSDSEFSALALSNPSRLERGLAALWNLVSLRRENAISHPYSNEFHRDNTVRFQPSHLHVQHYTHFRHTALERLSEVLSVEIASAMVNLIRIRAWQRLRTRITQAVRFFMQEHIVPHYGNVVSGLAYAGAAFLIVSVGLRGLRFIPASRPSILLATISLECVFLLLLGVTLAFQREESSGVESLKRIEYGMSDVARVIANVDTSIIERVLQESAAAYARTPEMQNRVFDRIAECAMDALRAQAPSAKTTAPPSAPLPSA